MNKKTLIIGTLILIIILGLFILFRDKEAAKPGKPVPTPSLTTAVTPDITKINISGVEVNPKGDSLIVDNEKYQIVYLSQFNKFLITVLGSPFNEIKNEAEREFLKVLGITEENACKLIVEVNTPEFANPEYSGTALRLSFCK